MNYRASPLPRWTSAPFAPPAVQRSPVASAPRRARGDQPSEPGGCAATCPGVSRPHAAVKLQCHVMAPMEPAKRVRNTTPPARTQDQQKRNRTCVGCFSLGKCISQRAALTERAPLEMSAVRATEFVTTNTSETAPPVVRRRGRESRGLRGVINPGAVRLRSEAGAAVRCLADLSALVANRALPEHVGSHPMRRSDAGKR
jgi:hypothetical protein